MANKSKPQPTLVLDWWAALLAVVAALAVKLEITPRIPW
jgi:hypothetical protein